MNGRNINLLGKGICINTIQIFKLKRRQLSLIKNNVIQRKKIMVTVKKKYRI